LFFPLPLYLSRILFILFFSLFLSFSISLFSISFFLSLSLYSLSSYCSDTKIRRLDRGAHGEVLLFHHVSMPGEFVVRRIPKPHDTAEQLDWEREVETVSAVKSPFIMKVIDHFETDDDRFIVMEYCSGGTLAQQLQLRSQDAVLFNEKV
jgi:serine/threonine protein kinase